MSRSFIPVQQENQRQLLKDAEIKDLNNLEKELRDRELQENFNEGTPQPHHSPLSDEQWMNMAREKVMQLNLYKSILD